MIFKFDVNLEKKEHLTNANLLKNHEKTYDENFVAINLSNCDPYP